MRIEPYHGVCAALERAIFSLVLVLLFATPLFLIPRVVTQNSVLDQKNLFACVASSLAAALCAIRLFLFREKKPLRRDFFRLAILGYGASIILSALFSGEVWYSLGEGLKILPLLTIVLAFPEIIKRESDLSKMRTAILSAGFLVSVFALCQYMQMDIFKEWFPYRLPGSQARNYMISTIGNPEYLGSYLAPLALLALAGAFSEWGGWRGWTGLALGAIFLPSLLLTGSRGALIGLGAGSCLLLVFYLKHSAPIARRRIIIAAIIPVCLAFFVAIVFSFPNPINRRNHAILQRFREAINIRSESLKERVLFHAIGAEIIAENPLLGAGEGMFRVRFFLSLSKIAARDERAGVLRAIEQLRNRVADHSHNDYLQVWVENGALGFLFFTLAIAVIIGEMWQGLFLTKRGAAVSRHLPSFGAALVCILVNAVFSFPLHTPSRAVLFWCLLGASHAAALWNGMESGLLPKSGEGK